MGFDKIAIMSRKDLKEIWENTYMRLTLLSFPIFITFLATLIVFSISIENRIPIFMYTNNFVYNNNLVIVAEHLVIPYFLLSVSLVPVVLATHSLIGEKYGNTIEVLLSAPITDRDILLGKIIAVFLPVTLLFMISFLSFTFLVDYVTFVMNHAIYLPDAYSILSICITGPLYAFLATTSGLIISSRVNDIKAAQQIGSIVILPVLGLLIMAQYNMGIYPMIVFSAILFILDIILFEIAVYVFKREEVLVRWSK